LRAATSCCSRATERADPPCLASAISSSPVRLRSFPAARAWGSPVCVRRHLYRSYASLRRASGPAGRQGRGGGEAAHGRPGACRRFDARRCFGVTQDHSPVSNMRYFYSTLVGYFLGLSITVGVMYYFASGQVGARVVCPVRSPSLLPSALLACGAAPAVCSDAAHGAQPALLYLVPTCLGGAFIEAMRRGQVCACWPAQRCAKVPVSADVGRARARSRAVELLRGEERGHGGHPGAICWPAGASGRD
jgi:hypothetical protein